MKSKTYILLSWVLNVVAAAIWAANCIMNTSLVIKIIAAALCVAHSFLAGILYAVWEDT